jgi:hypothetical protein
MYTQKPILLLDVDGVLCVPSLRNPVIELVFDVAEERSRNYGFFGKGIPVRKDISCLKRTLYFYPCNNWDNFLRWADQNFEIVWLTAWFERANLIGAKAGISEKQALLTLPGKDWKVSSAKAFRDGFYPPTLWLEDGFSDEAEAWAKGSGVKLVKTNFKIGVTEETIKEMKEFLEAAK